MDNSNVTILVDAKQEYTKQLIQILKGSIYNKTKAIYKDAHKSCIKNKKKDKILITFQEYLSKIPKWSDETINEEYSVISKTTDCDWIDDLLTAVFITHTKILTMVHKGEQNKKINLKIPKASHFIHLCYIETARQFWKNPYLFSEKVSQYDYQRNMRDCDTIIGEAIMETIRKQLPVKHILKEYLGDSYQSEAEDEDSVENNSSPKHLKNIQKMIKKEINEQNDNLNIDNENQLKSLIKDEVAKQMAEPTEKESNEEPSNQKLSDGLIIEKMETTNLNDLITEEVPIENSVVEEVTSVEPVVLDNESKDPDVKETTNDETETSENDIVSDENKVTKDIRDEVKSNEVVVEEVSNDDENQDVIDNNLTNELDNTNDINQDEKTDEIKEVSLDNNDIKQLIIENNNDDLNLDLEVNNDDNDIEENVNSNNNDIEENVNSNENELNDDELNDDELNDDELNDDELDDDELDDDEIDSDDLDSDLDSDVDSDDLDDSDMEDDNNSDTMSITDIDDINIDLGELDDMEDINNVDLNELSESKNSSQLINSKPKEFSFYDE